MPLTIDSIDLPLGPKLQGKVRDFWDLGDRRLILTTDRQSAFDKVLGTIPYKGQILTAMTCWWFEHCSDIVPNHLIAQIDPNLILVRRAKVWPVEMVIRGYIYAAGRREIYGLNFPEGLKKNQRLDAPVITPTSKAMAGDHDAQLSAAQILEQGVVPEPTYRAMEAATRALFARGRELAAGRGLILVDTKYEFGDIDGQLTLIDEIHTVDSSRYWLADSYQARLEAGEEPDTFDKEFLRRWYVAQGYRGDGPAPGLPPVLAEQMSGIYRQALERLTGTAFVPDMREPRARIMENLRQAGLI